MLKTSPKIGGIKFNIEWVNSHKDLKEFESSSIMQATWADRDPKEKKQMVAELWKVAQLSAKPANANADKPKEDVQSESN